ncbi:L7Ae/L30e/S12e/Gadd45 family ribosomal protein [Brotaphodocola sp.]|uniref:L7Ae/L30e/S12e/Gadd45 family ribosomal protein n=1 Tax=Brotaphodocola sp. TaxID=3073577 RepID=UPI003D7D23A7
MRHWKRRWKILDNRQKILNLIGLATKAGKTASGEFSTEKAVKTGKARLVLVSEEASENTKKMFSDMCTYYKVPICYFGSKDELGHAMGKEMRASLAVTDTGLAGAIQKQMAAKSAADCADNKQ